ncbi:MAG: Holliday junction branch migration protein RuvA [Lachnospiraceae bacterium]
MISYIRGTLAEAQGSLIVVEAGSVGVNINVPLSLVEGLPSVGEEVTIYTCLRVTDDALTLYGFGSRNDLEMFRQLLNVSGIGPKGALGLLSVLTPDELRVAVVTGDAKALTRAPGVGAKTAQRIILDLKDRVSLDELSYMPEQSGGAAASSTSQSAQALREAIEALVQLGYAPTEAARAVRKVENSSAMDAEAILKAALKGFHF